MSNVVPIGNRSWRDRLQMTSQGVIKGNLLNGCIAVREAPELAELVKYNEFADRVQVAGSLPWDSRESRAWTPHDDLALTEWMQAEDIQVRTTIAAEAVERVAYENRYHPVLEWLESLKWDGRDRLSSWLTYYLGVPASPLVSAIGRKFLISAAARIYKPGCKVDHMLILEGTQGLMKSTAIRTLAGEEWFTDQIADLGTKDSSQDLRGKWIVELAELSAIRPNEVEKVKAYVARQADHYRPSFGRRAIDVPRQCVFIGTTNSTEYLSDETGNRRYWPVACLSIDIEALAVDRDQLWAEAASAYQTGETWWIDDDDLRAAIMAEQEVRRVSDPWEAVIADWLDNPTKSTHDGSRFPVEIPGGRVTARQILWQALEKPIAQQTRSDEMRIGRILRHLGLQKTKAHGRTEWLKL